MEWSFKTASTVLNRKFKKLNVSHNGSPQNYTDINFDLGPGGRGGGIRYEHGYF